MAMSALTAHPADRPAHRPRRSQCPTSPRPARDATASINLSQSLRESRTPAALVPIMDLQDVHVFYDDYEAVREVDLADRPQRDHRPDRPLRVRQVDPAALPQPDERPGPRRPGRGQDHLPRRRPLRPGRRCHRGPPPGRHGLPEAQPVPQVDLRQHRLRPARARPQGQHGRRRRGGADPGRAVGRGQGQAQAERPGAVRRPAAAAVHRPLHRGQPRGDPDGRAVRLARPDRDHQDRGPHAGAGARLHDRDRHPQHAAGRPRLRPHRVLHRRARRGRACATAGSSSSTAR